MFATGCDKCSVNSRAPPHNLTTEPLLNSWHLSSASNYTPSHTSISHSA